MGFGKNKNSINEWRIKEREELRRLCNYYGLEIAEETEGRGKTFTPDEYKQIRDEAKEEMKTDPDIMDELRAEVEGELLSEQQHLVDDIAKHKGEVTDLQTQKNMLKSELVSIEGELEGKEKSLDNKLKKANSEIQKYKQLYNQECSSTSDLLSQLAHQKSEAKRWEGNYNNLYRQHVQLKRSKGLEIE